MGYLEGYCNCTRNCYTSSNRISKSGCTLYHLVNEITAQSWYSQTTYNYKSCINTKILQSLAPVLSDTLNTDSKFVNTLEVITNNLNEQGLGTYQATIKFNNTDIPFYLLLYGYSCAYNDSINNSYPSNVYINEYSYIQIIDNNNPSHKQQINIAWSNTGIANSSDLVYLYFNIYYNNNVFDLNLYTCNPISAQKLNGNGGFYSVRQDLLNPTQFDMVSASYTISNTYPQAITQCYSISRPRDDYVLWNLYNAQYKLLGDPDQAKKLTVYNTNFEWQILDMYIFSNPQYGEVLCDDGKKYYCMGKLVFPYDDW